MGECGGGEGGTEPMLPVRGGAGAPGERGGTLAPVQQLWGRGPILAPRDSWAEQAHCPQQPCSHPCSVRPSLQPAFSAEHLQMELLAGGMCGPA